MQAFIEFIAGLIAVLATAALSHLGVDVERRAPEPREIQRVQDCPETSSPAQSAIRAAQDC